jgi:hypothetical protein
MATYALIGPGNVIVRIQDDRRLDLTAGVRAGYSWRIVENVTNNTSTLPPRYTKTATVQTIEPTRVLRTTTVSDMTPAEQNAVVAAEADGTAGDNAGKALLSVFRTLFALARQVNPNITPLQFKTFVDNATGSTTIPETAFKAWLAELLR